MIILAVHSTTSRLAVASIRDGKVLAERILPPGRGHLENLAVLIKAVTEQVGLTIRDVDGFGVALGPGSFSGVRVGLATIKGIALVNGRPVAGVSSLEALAWEGLREGETGTAIIDARRGDVFWSLYKRQQNKLTLLEGPHLALAHELGRFSARGELICGDEPSGRLVEGTGISYRTVTGCSAASCGILAWNSLRNGHSNDLHALVPLYVRRSDAEEKRNAGQGT